MEYDPEVEHYPRIRKDQISDFCEQARKDAGVFKLAKHFVAKRLRAHTLVPYPINFLISDYLEGRFEPRGEGSGRPSEWARDIIIMSSIRELVNNHDLVATHRRELSSDPERIRKSKKSASEFVQAALKLTSIGVVERKRIHDIYVDREKQAYLQEYLDLRVEAEFDDEPEAERL
ncbi:MAG: hypothetical protein AAGB06_07110 [Verrucomicrobiota bacterium]